MNVRKVVDIDDDYVVIVVKNNEDQTEMEDQQPEIKTEIIEEEDEDYSFDDLRAMLEGSPVSKYTMF